jgi:hypothetical protein
LTNRLTRFLLSVGVKLVGQLWNAGPKCPIGYTLSAKFIFKILGLIDPH